MKVPGPMDTRATWTVAQVMDRLRDPFGDEWAFVDVREIGEAAEGHPFGSVNIPYSTLECDIDARIPRRGTQVVLIDGGDGVANRAASRLLPLGYVNLAIVAGGIPAWEGAALPLLKGVHTWSKAFGEWVQHAFETPEISPEMLARHLSEPNPPLLIDVRPLAEHRKFTLPGALNCPNAELGLQLPGLVAPDQRIVVHCAGRTRSIIGAQTLRDLGLPNPVMALRDGTQGWELAGFTRAIGVHHAVQAAPSPKRLTDAAAEARKMMAREAVPQIDPATLKGWLQQSKRTTYLFDPRGDTEGTVPQGFRRTPGTTLIQQTDQFVAVRGARVVLFDPTVSRAAFAALWLRRMGIDAYVLDGPPPSHEVSAASQTDPAQLPSLSGSDLGAHIRMGGRVVDLRSFAAFAAAHVVGAIRCPRPLLDRLPIEGKSRIAIVSDAPVMAALAASDLTQAGHQVVGVALADPDAWGAAGITIAQSDPDTADAADDSRIDEVRFCAGRHAGNLDHARAYLAWETGLLAQLSPLGLVPWTKTEQRDA